LDNNIPDNTVQSVSAQDKEGAEKILVEQPQQNKQPQPQPTEEKTEDPNWRAFREARKKDRAEKEAAEKRAAEKEAEADALKKAMEAAFAKSATQPTQSEYASYENDESEDDRIEKKVLAALAAREEKFEKNRVQREQQEFPAKLQKMYPDFNQIVSEEHLDYLEYNYPEVARPLQRLSDGFEKWEDIYRAVKKFVPNVASAKKDAQKAEANFKKPQSLSNLGANQSPVDQISTRISEDRKQQNWQRMQRLLKGGG